jgi:hypothetical protein
MFPIGGAKEAAERGGLHGETLLKPPPSMVKPETSCACFSRIAVDMPTIAQRR